MEVWRSISNEFAEKREDFCSMLFLSEEVIDGDENSLEVT